MPFTATTWADSPATTSPIDAANLNNMSVQYQESINSFEQDLLTPFVFSGLVATRDGSTLSQLDVTAGVAFPLQSDSTLRRRAPTSSTQSTTGHASTTMHLYLQPDGTWYWSTSNSPATNSLFIASVTTDASANIATVTDQRTLNTTLLSGMAGLLTLPTLASLTSSGSITSTNGNAFLISTPSSGNSVLGWNSPNVHWDAPGGDASVHGFYFGVWGGSSYNVPFSIGTTVGSSYVDTSGVHGNAVYDNSNRVAVSGPHTAGPIALSYGSGVPGSLASNEVYFQVS